MLPNVVRVFGNANAAVAVFQETTGNEPARRQVMDPPSTWLASNSARLDRLAILVATAPGIVPAICLVVVTEPARDAIGSDNRRHKQESRHEGGQGEKMAHVSRLQPQIAHETVVPPHCMLPRLHLQFCVF